MLNSNLTNPPLVYGDTTCEGGKPHLYGSWQLSVERLKTDVEPKAIYRVVRHCVICHTHERHDRWNEEAALALWRHLTDATNLLDKPKS